MHRNISSQSAGAAGDINGDSERVKQKDKIQFLSRRNARSSHTTMQNVLKRKIYVSSDRGKELQQFQHQAEMADRAEPEHSQPSDTMVPTQTLPQVEPVESESTDDYAGRVPILLLGFTDDQVRWYTRCR